MYLFALLYGTSLWFMATMETDKKDVELCEVLFSTEECSDRGGHPASIEEVLLLRGLPIRWTENITTGLTYITYDEKTGKSQTFIFKKNELAGWAEKLSN